ncbi:MAG: hypothetical protein QNJ55_04750 [Xenococcus sp. MO_188.B8]|nr:hypothetical protein [Xenococcus sp. MO_188.B8]
MVNQQFQAWADVVGVDSLRLRAMLPPKGTGMKCAPIRLCGACYGEVPCHRMEWQYKSVWKCDKHQLKLISKCLNCRAKFKMPALWEHGCCHWCRLSFEAIAKYQKLTGIKQNFNALFIIFCQSTRLLIANSKLVLIFTSTNIHFGVFRYHCCSMFYFQ